MNLFLPSCGKILSSSLTDIGIERMYLPGTVLPDITTEISAVPSIFFPLRIMSMERYSTVAPASMAAPAIALTMGDM